MNGGAVKKDFIPIEGIEKLRNLKTLNQENKDEVRDRLFALLGYDLALRLNEILSLKVSDFRKDENGDWFVVLRPEILKGSNKDAEMMYFFFEETKEILELYLNKIREKFRPTTDYLILSNQWGRRLCDTGCATKFKEMCEKLDIKTYYGEEPSPHVLRHSFATLNIEPIGINIPLYEMSQRLRHNRVETTRKHYIHNNPYLKKMKHEVLRKKSKKKTPKDILNELSLADLEHWLSDSLETDSLTIATIRRNHKRKFCEVPESPISDNSHFIGEDEVKSKLEHLNIPLCSLRQYAYKNRLLANDFKGGFRHGKGFRYKEDFVLDLAKNWISIPTIQKKLKLDPRSFQRTVSKEKWRTVEIGKQRFIHRDDCI